jgi:hypothetical protein
LSVSHSEHHVEKRGGEEGQWTHLRARDAPPQNSPPQQQQHFADGLGFLQRLSGGSSGGRRSVETNAPKSPPPSHRQQRRQDDEEARPRSSVQPKPVAVAAVSAVSGYYCVKSILKVSVGPCRMNVGSGSGFLAVSFAAFHLPTTPPQKPPGLPAAAPPQPAPPDQDGRPRPGPAGRDALDRLWVAAGGASREGRHHLRQRRRRERGAGGARLACRRCCVARTLLGL